MPSSNNANAGMGNASTKSNNASAAPVVISGSGPAPSPSTTPLAVFDFSTMSNQDLKANGTYTIPIASGTTSATTAQLRVFKGNTGIGANGIQRIQNGFLEFNPDIVTSEFGASYWSTTSCPFLGIDLRTLSSALLTDTKFQYLCYEIKVEIEPFMTNGTKVQMPSYVYSGYGVFANLDTWDAGTATRPLGCAGFCYFTSNTGVNRDFSYGAIQTSSVTDFTRASFSQGQTQTSPAPLNTLYNTTSKQINITYNASMSSIINHYNGSAYATRQGGLFASYQTWTPPNTYNERATNNLWLTIFASRSSGTFNAADVPHRIKKISIYERSPA